MGTDQRPGSQTSKQDCHCDQDRAEVGTNSINRRLGRDREIVVVQIAERDLGFGIHPQLLPLMRQPNRIRTTATRPDH